MSHFQRQGNGQTRGELEQENKASDFTFFASCVRGLVPARSVNQLFMELCDLAVTSEKLSFWLTCGLRLPVSGNVL